MSFTGVSPGFTGKLGNNYMAEATRKNEFKKTKQESWKVYCTILNYAILYYSVLYCTILYYTVLYCTIPIPVEPHEAVAEVSRIGNV